MGAKAKKSKEEIIELLDVLLKKLEGIEGITSKRMFGGAGVFIDKKMFAMVTGHGHYTLKTNPETCQKFEEAGGEKFMSMPYHTIPDRVFNDQDLFLTWVEEAILIATA